MVLYIRSRTPDSCRIFVRLVLGAVVSVGEGVYRDGTLRSCKDAGFVDFCSILVFVAERNAWRVDYSYWVPCSTEPNHQDLLCRDGCSQHLGGSRVAVRRACSLPCCKAE